MVEEGTGALKRTHVLDGFFKSAFYLVALAMGLFHIYTAGFGILDTILHRSLHLGFALVLIFLLYPSSAKHPGRYRALDLLLAALSAAATAYMWAYYEYLNARITYVDPLTPADWAVGVLIVLLVLESSRRTVGMPMVLIALAFLFYGLFGEHFPGTFKTPDIPVRNLIDGLSISTYGIFGFAIGISSTFIFLFILFGGFLQVSGVGQLFSDAAFALTGRAKGGPAKAAVISSALFGTISGSAVANVYATGTFTIPMMLRVGYAPRFAGAVEAAASSGGQFTPPVMGAAAFIMMDITGIPYVHIALSAVLPALLYYWTMYWAIHFEAERQGLRAMDMTGRPSFGQVVRRNGHLALPVAAIIALLVFGYTPFLAAFLAILMIPVISYIRRETRIGLAAIGEAIQIGVRNSLPIVSACATAGIIMAVVTLTGVGFKFVEIVISVSRDILVFGLVLTAIAALVLGMGLPTTGAYILVAALGAPALVKLGISDLSAHMFVFFFAIISAITPPVALAAYAGASIAGANMMSTGITATRLGLAAFILPFYFVYRPAILLEGAWPEIFLVGLVMLLGLFLVSAALGGWAWIRLTRTLRVLYMLAGVLLIYPHILMDLAGIAGGAALLVYSWRKGRKTAIATPKLDEPKPPLHMASSR